MYRRHNNKDRTYEKVEFARSQSFGNAQCIDDGAADVQGTHEGVPPRRSNKDGPVEAVHDCVVQKGHDTGKTKGNEESYSPHTHSLLSPK